jgi:hypothetical protein
MVRKRYSDEDCPASSDLTQRLAPIPSLSNEPLGCRNCCSVIQGDAMHFCAVVVLT